MEIHELRSHLKEEINTAEEDLLGLISLFLYNWTEGPWTPPPLSKEQIEEIEKRAEAFEKGKSEAIPMEEVFEELEKKYGFFREEGETYKLGREKEVRAELMKMLQHVNREQLLQLEMFLESHKQNKQERRLTKTERLAIKRGQLDSKEGRLSDAFEFLSVEG